MKLILSLEERAVRASALLISSINGQSARFFAPRLLAMMIGSLAATFCYAVWIDVASEVCMASFGLRCLGGFFNRYQTLIAGTAAIGAAWYASRPVYAELAETSRQSAALVREIVIDIAKSYEAEFYHLKNSNLLEDSLSEITWIKEFPSNIEFGRSYTVETLMRGISGEIDYQMARFARTNVEASAKLHEGISKYIDELMECRVLIEKCGEAIASIDVGKLPIDGTTVVVRCAQIHRQLHKIAEARVWLQQYYWTEIVFAWIRVRELETLALGPYPDAKLVHAAHSASAAMSNSVPPP